MGEDEVAVSTLEVLDPEMLRMAIRRADLEPCLMSSRPSPSRLIRLECSRLCLDLVSVGPAMAYAGMMPRNCYTLTFVLTCPGKSQSFNFGTDFTAGYLGLFPPGAQLDAYSVAGSEDAILTVPVEEFEAAAAVHFPEIPGRILARGAGMRVDPGVQGRVRTLVDDLKRVILERGDGAGDPAPCGRLRNELLPAFFAILRSGCEALVPLPSARLSRRYGRWRQAREFIQDHLDEAVSVADLCEEIGLSERGVECLFQDLVGVSPTSFLRRQRLHCARRKLQRAGYAPGVVKRVAIESGCWHLGRFSHDYRTMFGEMPSETLADSLGRASDLLSSREKA